MIRNSIATAERRATRPVPKKDVDRTMNGLSSVGNILPSPINQFIQDLRSSMPNLSVGIGASFGNRGRSREPERQSRRQQNVDSFRDRSDRSSRRTMNNIASRAPEPMMDLRDPFPMQNSRSFEPSIDNLEARFDRNRNRLPDFTSGFGISNTQQNDPWLQSGNFVDRFAPDPTFLLSGGKQPASPASSSSSVAAPIPQQQQNGMTQNQNNRQRPVSGNVFSNSNQQQTMSSQGAMMNNQGTAGQGQGNFANVNNQIQGQQGLLFRSPGMLNSITPIQSTSTNTNTMQMQGQGPQNLMNNIPRQTGNGQVQSFNQGSNALQNQRNLQISNQMLTQSQNIGQTLPMIQNSQTNNQQLQQPQLSGFQVQPQMQMQNQVNQQLFSKQIQTQSNVNQVNSAITQQGQGQSNTGRSQSQQQEASRIQNLLSQAFKPVQNNQVQGQMQNSNGMTGSLMQQNVQSGTANIMQGLNQGQGQNMIQQANGQLQQQQSILQGNGQVQQTVNQQNAIQGQNQQTALLTSLLQQLLATLNGGQSGTNNLQNNQIKEMQGQGGNTQRIQNNQIMSQNLKAQNILQNQQQRNVIQTPQQTVLQNAEQNPQLLLQQLLQQQTRQQVQQPQQQVQQIQQQLQQLQQPQQQTIQQTNLFSGINTKNTIQSIPGISMLPNNGQVIGNNQQTTNQNNQMSQQQQGNTLLQLLGLRGISQVNSNTVNNQGTSNPVNNQKISKVVTNDVQPQTTGNNINKVTQQTNSNAINNQGNQLSANLMNQQFGLVGQLQLLNQLNQGSQLNQVNQRPTIINKNQPSQLNNLLNQQLLTQALNIQGLTGNNQALTGNTVGIAGNSQPANGNKGTQPPTENIPVINLQTLLGNNPSLIIPQNLQNQKQNQQQNLQVQQTGYQLISMVPNEIEIAPPITLPPTVPSTITPTVFSKVNKTAQSFILPMYRQKQDQNLNQMINNLPLEVSGNSKLSPAEVGVTQATINFEQATPSNNFVIKLNKTSKGIRLIPDGLGGVRVINLRAAASTQTPWVGGENATDPALSLSLFQNNETLRKLERTDRLNTTDIPEEIELPNGTSLDGPGPTAAISSVFKSASKTTQSMTPNPGEQEETTTPMDMSEMDFELEEGLSTTSSEATDPTTTTSAKEITKMITTTRKPTTFRATTIPTTSTTPMTTTKPTTTTQTTTAVTTEGFPTTNFMTFAPTTPQTFIHSSLGWLSPFSTTPVTDIAASGGLLNINDPNMQTKPHEPALFDILSEVMLGRMKG